MEVFKDIFQDQALTYEEFLAALEEHGDVQLVEAPEAEATTLEPGEDAAAELLAANARIAELEQQVQDWAARYEADMQTVRRDAAVDQAILQAKGRNVKAIRALLDLDQVVLNEDGTLSGLDLEALKRSDGYLFEDEVRKKSGPGLAGDRDSDQERMRKQFEEAVWAR